MIAINKTTDAVNEELFEAVMAADFDGVKNAVAKGADINALNLEGDSVLHSTAVGDDDKNSQEICKYLIERGADINIRNKAEGMTPLHWAVDNNPHICDILLAAGADVNAKDNGGYTALYFAAFDGNLKTTKVLLKYKADPNLSSEDGFTPLHMSVWHGYAEISRLLILAGADLHAKTLESQEEPLDLCTDDDIRKSMAQLLTNYETLATADKRNDKELNGYEWEF